MLLEIRKLNCDVCKLKTEHHLETDGDKLIASRCLKCGQYETDVQFLAESVESYPVDESRPVYVV